MKSYVALLRGINVGGKNKLAMADLIVIFEEAGCSEVRSYIQSGNLLFRSSSALARKLPALVAGAIRSRFGYQVPLVLREAHELRALALNNPYLQQGHDPKTLHLMCLADAPSAAQATALDAHRSAPDAFHLRGRDVYLYLPNGVARSKLTNAYFDRTLATVSTLRNWNTLTKLIEMADH